MTAKATAHVSPSSSSIVPDVSLSVCQTSHGHFRRGRKCWKSCRAASNRDYKMLKWAVENSGSALRPEGSSSRSSLSAPYRPCRGPPSTQAPRSVTKVEQMGKQTDKRGVRRSQESCSFPVAINQLKRPLSGGAQLPLLDFPVRLHFGSRALSLWPQVERRWSGGGPSCSCLIPNSSKWPKGSG